MSYKMKLVEKISYKSIFGKDKKTITMQNVKVFENKNGFVVEHIGGNNKCYDYVVNNLLIATRLGFSEKLLNLLAKNNVHPLDYDKKFQINKEINES